MSQINSKSLETRFLELTRNAPEFRIVPFQLSIDAANVPPRELAVKASSYVGNEATTEPQMAAGLAQALVRSWPREGVDMAQLRTELTVLAKNPRISPADRDGARLLLNAMNREDARTPPRL